VCVVELFDGSYDGDNPEGVNMSERSSVIFNNKISNKVYKKAVKNRKKLVKKFGDDSSMTYPLMITENPILSPFIGVKNIGVDHNLSNDTTEVPKNKSRKVTNLNPQPEFDENSLVVGNIRMGFGHYRISMAIASAAYHMGYTPYWYDLHSFETTTGGKVISHLNDLYSFGSRLSQKYSLFNKFYWEPLNSEGFKKLSYNAMDQEMSKLMTPAFRQLPKQIPYIATHVWPAQAAVHAGVEKVVNVIPDNWPMALHLAEGSIHTVQTPSAYLGYRTLKNMSKSRINHPMSANDIVMTGHYVDHELVENIKADNEKRLKRLNVGGAKRFLITVGGAGAQKEIFVEIIRKLLPAIRKNKEVLYLNVGDHFSVWEDLIHDIPELKEQTQTYFDKWEDTVSFANGALTNEVSGIHAFYHKDVYAAVYSTNLLIRSSDVLITKPSELSFYPIPKLLIKRVGGHEAWGAVRSAEIGDGTLECETKELTLQMLDLLLNEEDILTQMCHNINKANEIGVYDGAYKAVALATGFEGEYK